MKLSDMGTTGLEQTVVAAYQKNRRYGRLVRGKAMKVLRQRFGLGERGAEAADRFDKLVRNTMRKTPEAGIKY